MNAEKKVFSYSLRSVEILAVALKNAIEETQDDPRCIDWLSYHPDFYRHQKDQKAA